MTVALNENADVRADLPPCWSVTRTVSGSVPIQAYVAGDDDAPPLLLVHGLGQCVTDWPTELIDALATIFRVIAIDNRDVGRSGHLDRHGSPPLLRLWLGQKLGVRLARPIYRIHDMANDVVRVCDDFGLGAVHCVGASMGGMVVQRMALQAPSRVSSLSLIMSSSGAPGLPSAEPIIERMMRADAGPQRSAQEAIDAATKLRAALAVVLSASDRAELASRVARSVDYGWPSGEGVARQFAAIFDDQSRASEISAITAPALVIHGSLDPLLPPEHGLDLAERLSARFEEIANMGHEITASLAEPLAGSIIAHARTHSV